MAGASSGSDAAELSSVASSLDDLLARVRALAERRRGGEDATSAHLDEAERALQAAARALRRAGEGI